MQVSDNKPFSSTLIRIIPVILGLTAVFLLSQPAISSTSAVTGRVYYAAPATEEAKRGGDGTENDPWRSLQHAVDKLSPGDTLYLTGGVYGQSAIFKTSGEPDKPITIYGRGTVRFDGSRLGEYEPVFDTAGHSYLIFENFHVDKARAAVAVNGGQNVQIIGVSAADSHFTVVMRDAAFVKLVGCEAKNNRNGFRGEGTTHNVAMFKIKAVGSKDIYDGYEEKVYLNGDGIIFEEETYQLVFKNIISSGNWDAGLDIKGSNVVIENVFAEKNKNGLKLWGNDITVINAFIHDSRSQILSDGNKIDGAGINVRAGNTLVKDSTVFNNELVDVKVSRKGELNVEGSIVSRKRNDGRLTGPWGKFSARSVLWFAPKKSMLKNYKIGDTDLWADPLIQGGSVNTLYPKNDSPAFRNGQQVFGAKPVSDITMIHEED